MFDKVFWFVYRQLLALRMGMLRLRYESWKKEFERDSEQTLAKLREMSRARGESPTVLEPEDGSSRARTPERNPDRLNWN